MKLNVYQLANELDLQPGTLRTWLSNYRFNKSRISCKPLTFDVTKDFLTCLEGYIGLKQQNEKIVSTLHHLRWLRSRIKE